MRRLHRNESRIETGLLARGFPVGEVRWYDEVGSTMDVAFGIEPEALKERTLIVADVQTRGRGRFGRSWCSTSEDLLFSLVLTRFDSETPYGMVAALAVFNVLRTYAGGLTLKWVNDVLCRDGKKIAGILVEERPGRTVIGAGINLNDEEFPAELSPRASSLLKETGSRVPKEEILISILCALLPALDRCGAGKIGDLLAEWEAASGMNGRRVVVRNGEKEYEGTVRGLNRETGALILRIGNRGAPGEEIELYDGSLAFSDARWDEE